MVGRNLQVAGVSPLLRQAGVIDEDIERVESLDIPLVASPASGRHVLVIEVQRFNVTFALSTTLTHLGSGEALEAYSSCQFHQLYGGVWG